MTISATAIGNDDSARYYEINSTDNGQSWSSPVLLPTASTYYSDYVSSNPFFGDYNRSVRSQCRVYTGWADGRNNLGPKVYFFRTNYCTTGVNELTSVTKRLPGAGD